MVLYFMTQCSLKAGIKRHGKDGKEATAMELLQLHTMDTFQPIDSKEPAYKENKNPSHH